MAGQGGRPARTCSAASLTHVWENKARARARNDHAYVRVVASGAEPGEGRRGYV